MSARFKPSKTEHKAHSVSANGELAKSAAEELLLNIANLNIQNMLGPSLALFSGSAIEEMEFCVY